MPDKFGRAETTRQCQKRGHKQDVQPLRKEFNYEEGIIHWHPAGCRSGFGSSHTHAGKPKPEM